MNLIKVTLILPIRNEGAYLAAALDAVLAQDYPRELLEILITDSMSTDETREIVKEYIRKDPRIQMFDNPGRIVPTGMNIALRQAEGDIIIRVDGHCIIAPDYVSKCVEVLTRTKADNCGGCMTACGTNIFGKAVALATSTPFGVGNSKFHYSQKEEEVDSVYLGAWPKQVFKSIGLFDEELVRNQDDEFNYRLRKAGGKIILSPEIKSQYFARSDPKRLYRQYFQYGFYKVRVLQKHPRQMSLRQFVPPFFVLSLLSCILLALAVNWGWIVLAALAGSYTISNLAASMSIGTKKGWQYVWLLPFVFTTIHIGYGSGFLSGVIKFWNRWDDKIGKVPVN